mgnify:CR=1 FL=1
MIATVIGGFVFLGSQVWEWAGIIVGPDGVFGTYDDTTMQSNFLGGWLNGAPIEGPKQYAQIFYCVTGFHGFHVTIGVFLLFLCFYQAAVGVYDKRGHYEMVEKIGLYWHFVDLVWVFVFTLFYLI